MLAHSPKTSVDFEALVAEDREAGGAAIDPSLSAIHTEFHDKKGWRIVAIRPNNTIRWLSTWQPTEEQAVHDAIARAFC